MKALAVFGLLDAAIGAMGYTATTFWSAGIMTPATVVPADCTSDS